MRHGKLLPYLPPEANSVPGWGQSAEGLRHFERLRLVGCALLKCVLDSFAVGPDLARFVFDFLLQEYRPLTHSDGAHNTGPFATADAAFEALRDFAGDRVTALRNVCLPQAWGVPLDVEAFVDFGFLPPPSTSSGHMGSAGGEANAGGEGQSTEEGGGGGGDGALLIRSQAEADAFLLRCSRHALLDSRRAALDALRDGFEARGFVSGAEELVITGHLSLFTPSEVATLVGGRRLIRPCDLIRMVVWPTEGDAQKRWRQPTPKSPNLLRDWLEGLDAAQCFDVFRCVTARAAVPDQTRCDIAIRLDALKDDQGQVAGPDFICAASTCFTTLKLPAYETAAQLERGMSNLLEHASTFSDR